MAINKKLIHFKNKENFDNEVANGNILDNSIVFIQDTLEIYTHGTFYDGKLIDLSNIEASIQDILDNKLDNISDLETIRSGAALGATSVQSVTAGNGLEGGIITDNGTISLATSGVTSGTYGPEADISGSNNNTIAVPQITVDDYGRVTYVTNRTYTSVNTTYSKMSASEATTGTATTARTITAKVLNDKIVETAVVNDGNILNIAKVTSLPSSPDANTLYIIVES